MFRLILFLFLAINVELLSANPPENGKVKTYFKNGKIEMVGHYKNGLKHRTWLYFGEDGKMLYKEKYKAGMLQWKVRYENGKVSEIIDKNGNIKTYSKCGC